MNTSPFQIFHIRATSSKNKGNHPFASLAFFGSGDSARVTACVASPKDNFNKSVARKILVDRSNSDKYSIPLTPSATISSILGELGLLGNANRKLARSHTKIVDQTVAFERQKDRVLYPLDASKVPEYAIQNSDYRVKKGITIKCPLHGDFHQSR